MSETTRDKTASELRLELRDLRESHNELADAVEELVEELNQRSRGRGPPEHAAAAREKARAARDRAGDPVPEDEQIAPPWEREGYESKAHWLADKRE